MGPVSGGQAYNIQSLAKDSIPIAPEQEARFWYMYYLQTERGRTALEQNRRKLVRYIWSLWSPAWAFDDETFANSASAFDNPDFVDIVLHSYRHRLGGVRGDPRYDGIEARLGRRPKITVPTIILQGADDGVDPPSK